MTKLILKCKKSGRYIPVASKGQARQVARQLGIVSYEIIGGNDQ